VIKAEPATGSIKVHMKQVKQVTPQTKNVDLHHMHVLPFTTKKPVVFHDLTPAILDRVNTKVLRTAVPVKKQEFRLGQALGLDVKFQVKTESEVFDRKALINALKNYRYNPLLVLAFANTMTALRADGTPSIRYHKATLIHNPQNSNTKEMKIDIKIAAALQEERRFKAYIAEASPKKSQQEAKLTQTIEKLRAKNAYAVHALVEVALVGGAPKNFVYSIAAAKGATEQEHKWNIHVESEAMPAMICVVGAMDIPVARAALQKLKYNNRIGFGANCDEFFVQMAGFARTSEQQVEASRRSEATRKCARLTRQVTELKERVQTMPQGERKAWLEQEHAQLIYKKRVYCQEQRREETALDKVELDITASPRLPAQVYTIAKYLDVTLKGVFYPYIAGLPVIQPVANPAVKVFLDFNQRLNTVTMRLASPLDTTLYRNIRLPRFVRNLLPLSFSRSVLEQSYKALYGSSLYAQCVIGQDKVITFAKKAFSYRLDDCNHLVAADCTQQKKYAVLAKEKDNVKHITVFYEDVKIVLRAAAAQFASNAPLKVEINGVEKVVLPGKKHVVRKGIEVQWAVEARTVLVDTPALRIRYDGKDVVVEEKLAAGRICGLCGENTQDKRADLKSPRMCVFKSIKSMVQSYRVEDSQCVSPLSTSDRNNLKSQSSMCTSSKTVKQQRLTQQKLQHTISKSVPRGPMYGGNKMISEVELRKHAIMRRAGEICFSKDQVAECAANAVARAIEPRDVEFVCRPLRDREAKDWVRMAREGKVIPQLRGLEKTFQARVELPRNCVRDY